MNATVRLSAIVLLLAAGARADTSAPQGEASAREQLVEELRRQGIKDQRVLGAIAAVPRHRFVPAELRAEAYRDRALPIGHGQTISQPYVVAFMTEAAGLSRGANVLEVGTGSGYQAAVLAEVLGVGPTGDSPSRLASIEIVPALAESSRALLSELGYHAEVRQGDGYRGWPERAPFDAIVVTAAPDHVPQPLKDQLKVGGRLVIPVGDTSEVQQLKVITRTETGFREETILPVRFVPMTGESRK